MQKQYWSGIVLITIGVLILLYQVEFVDFSRADLVTYGCVFLGIVFLVKGITHPQKNGILAGVFFFTFGLSMILMRERIFPRADEFGFAAFFICLALANGVYVFFKKDKSTNLIWMVVFAAVGGLFYWSYVGYYPPWYIYDQIKIYWPIILVLFGAGMIIRGYTRKNQSLQINGSEI